MTSPFRCFFSRNSIKGWSSHSPDNVHVKDLLECFYSKRLFRIFNRDYPYTLQLEVRHLSEEVKAKPVVTTHGMGVSIGYETTSKQIVTRRYKTEIEVNAECQKLLRLKETYQQYISISEKDFYDKVTKR